MAIIPIDAAHPQETLIRQAANMLRCGGLVAFPTETVYGLGANALNEEAVQRIFAAKGRPANNPLIVHVASIEQARELTTNWSHEAQLLADACWPGPLTLVLPAADHIPVTTRAGNPTVAIRMPSHPVALALIQAAGVPLAAPSANASGQLSPTRAEHVEASLGGKIDLILNAGSCEQGIESTVVSLSDDEPVLLRPGPIARHRLEEVLQREVRINAEQDTAAPASPGMLPKHYAPHTPLELLPLEEMNKKIEQQGKKKYALLYAEKNDHNLYTDDTLSEYLGDNPDVYAQKLYEALHRLDALSTDAILAQEVPDGADWDAVRDRLKRASHRE